MGVDLVKKSQEHIKLVQEYEISDVSSIGRNARNPEEAAFINRGRGVIAHATQPLSG